MWNIIGALIALGLLVTVHEAGHFVAALLFGVEVEKFSIGFGPKLFGFRKGKTEYRISLIPLGGYLKMKGENPDEEAEDNASFRVKKWWQRALIAFAGPFANFIFAVLIFILAFAIGRSYEDYRPIVGKVNVADYNQIQPNDTILNVNGYDVKGWSQIPQHIKENEPNVIQVDREGQLVTIEVSDMTSLTWVSDILPYVSAVIGDVAPGMPAYRAGLMGDDLILEVNGAKVKDWYQMRDLIKASDNDSVVLRIQRNGEVFDKTVNLEYNLIEDSRIIGITQKMPIKIDEKYNVLQSIKNGTTTTTNFVALYYVSLYKLFAKPAALKDSVGGPVMIYALSQQSAKKGWDAILAFVASISIILMIMNLLPIPVLDGGHIMFCMLEGIRKKPLSQNVQIALQNIGVFILLTLMMFAFWNDLSRVFTRNASINQQKTVIEQ